jgi:polyhydroxyalkanoate synthase
MTPPPAVPSSAPDPEAAAKALAETAKDALQGFAALNLPLDCLAKLQMDYVNEATEIWNRALPYWAAPAGAGSEPAPLGDRRFSAPDWTANPASALTAQLYLLNARTLLSLADQIEGDEKSRQRVRFAVQQWVDAVSPSNYLALNPEAQRYINRLSDWLFVAARHANDQGATDILWKPGASR